MAPMLIDDIAVDDIDFAVLKNVTFLSQSADPHHLNATVCDTEGLET